jgi:G3E family GTPase
VFVDSIRKADHAPVPANVITGALGVGKTSAIARLLGNKPSDEYWVVILNEFTDAGLDALTIASAASDAYDVTTIPGGCLCCTGELEFRRRLQALLRERRPDRILIEPSGIAHPGGLVEELRSFERAGAIVLKSVVALVDAARLHSFHNLGVERDQIEAADVLVLAKAEVTAEQDKERFAAEANAMFPPKRWIGWCSGAELAAVALDPPPATLAFYMPHTSSSHAEVRLHASDHQHGLEMSERTVSLGSGHAKAQSYRALDRCACAWIVPPEVTFNRVAIERALRTRPLPGIERLKAVLRTGVEHWTLVNVSLDAVDTQPSGWRRDSRIEVQLKPGINADWLHWDAWWSEMLA